MKLKVTLILLAIMAGIGLMVYLLLIGLGRKDEMTVQPIPSNDAATLFVQERKLLAQVEIAQTVRPGGPEFTMVRGKDANGEEKAVWLTGEDNRIAVNESALLKDGVPREQIVAKAKEKGVAENDILYIFPVPHDYTSHRLVWFVQQKGDRKHMLWYDFKTGDLIWEAYQDPTAWKLGK